MLALWRVLQIAEASDREPALPTASDYHILLFSSHSQKEPEIQMALVHCLSGLKMGYLLKLCKQKQI